MPKCGIYKITNLVNNHCYIGQSTDILARWRNHKTSGLNKDSTSHNFYYPLYRAFRKYGLENFSFEIIEECRREELNIREKYWIKFYNSFESGYNQTEGGDSAPHFNKLTKEQVDLIIKRLKCSLDTSDKIGEDYGVSGRTIRAINSGQQCYRDNETYPIRPPLWSIETKTDNNNKYSIKNYYCKICGAKIATKDSLCVKCSQIKQRKVERPEPLELARLIKENGFRATGKIFGVSDNSIKKWCKIYNIPYLKDDLIKWYNNQIGLVEDKEIKQKNCFRKTS